MANERRSTVTSRGDQPNRFAINRTTLTSLIPWLSATIIVCVGWINGVARFPTPGDEFQQFRESGSYVRVTVVALGYCALLGCTCAVLRSRGRRELTALGTALLIMGSFPVAFGLLLSAFSPCLLPGDTCLISWPHHLVPIVGALAGFTIGAITERRLAQAGPSS